MATVRAQCHSLLGRLETLGQGTAAAANQRWQAVEEEKRWSLATRQGWSSYRTGFAMADQASICNYLMIKHMIVVVIYISKSIY